MVQRIRSKLASHHGGSEANELSTNAITEHGNYTAHFESVCTSVARELAAIENAFSQDHEPKEE